MNTFLKPFIIMLAAAFAITACGGGNGGSSGGGTHGANTTPPGNFSKTIINTGAEGAGDIGSTDEGRYMMLYLADDMHGSGMINSISFRRSDHMSDPVTCSNVTVKMGHTNVTNLSATFADNYGQGQGSLQTVLSNTGITIPSGAPEEYFTIPLSQSFNYNGSDNLIVEITRSAACSEQIPLILHGADPAYYATCYSGTSSTDPTANFNIQYVVDIKFAFSGGDNKAASFNKGGDYSIGISPGYTGRTQMLILASDINGSGLITGMAVNPDSATGAANVTGMNVKIAHIPSGTTALSSTVFSENYGGSAPVTVTRDLSYQVPAGQPSAVWVPFNADSFTYDGTSNLLVDISCTVASGHYSVKYVSLSSGTNRVISSSDPNGTNGTLRERAFEPVFRFYGGSVYIAADNSAGAGIYFPFYDTDDNKIQYLYSASELGAKGRITKIALRLFSDESAASSYGSFNVTLGQTINTALGDSLFSENISGTKNVYSGIFTVPAGLIKGDWIEIPLSPDYTCDPAKNLVVQISSLAGTATNTIVRELDGTRYISRQAHAFSSTADEIEGVNNYLADIKLEIK